MRTLARLAVAGVLVLSLAGCTAIGDAGRDLARRLAGGGGSDPYTSGDSSGTGNTDIVDLQVGDCYREVDDDYTVDVVDCDKTHDDELFALLTMSGDAYPGDVAVDKFARVHCLTELEQYDQLPFEQSSLDYWYYVPDETGWKAGDHVIACYAYDWDYDPLTHSIAGAKL
jgi:hypothetical protein